MNNEETILDSKYDTESTEDSKKKDGKSNKRSTVSEKIAYAAGGAVAGAGIALGGQAVAAPQSDEIEAVAENQNEAVELVEDTKTEPASNSGSVNAPNPEEVIVATSTGIRVAQVDDDKSFSEVFADARSQVGAGGVFEWRGNVYGTYYKDEWEAMSSEERQEFQSSINYNDLTNSSDDSQSSASASVIEENVAVHETSNNDVEANSSIDSEVQVLAVGNTDLNGDGVPENAMVLEVNGHEVLVVDVDGDNMADIAIADVDGNGQISENEVADISHENLQMLDSTPGDVYMAQAESNPDYMNDANVGLYDA